MAEEDAEAAGEAGVDASVVSNHGGRVMDDMPGTARVLPAIARAVGDRIPVLADGGIRTGMDAFKMMALGARGVLVGRPAAIAAVGGETPAVKHLFMRYAREFAKTMNLCGLSDIEGIRAGYLMRAQEPGSQTVQADLPS